MVHVGDYLTRHLGCAPSTYTRWAEPWCPGRWFRATLFLWSYSRYSKCWFGRWSQLWKKQVEVLLTPSCSLKGATEDWSKESSVPCCVLQLEDIVDGSDAQYKVSEKSLELVVDTFKMHKIPVYYTWGNHQLCNFSRDFLANSKLDSKFLEDQTVQHPETMPSENS